MTSIIRNLNNAIRFALLSVNQRLPSGPTVIPVGTLLAVMPVPNSVTVPPGRTGGVGRTAWPSLLVKRTGPK